MHSITSTHGSAGSRQAAYATLRGVGAHTKLAAAIWDGRATSPQSNWALWVLWELLLAKIEEAELAAARTRASERESRLALPVATPTRLSAVDDSPRAAMNPFATPL